MSIEHEIRRILRLLEQILRLLQPQPGIARSAVLTLNGDSMPLTVHVNDVPGMAIFVEFDGLNGTGNKVPPVGTVTFSSSNPATASVDPNTGSLAYVAAGTTTISATDAGNSLSASDTLTVIASTAVSATLTLVPGLAKITAAATRK
jgi:hypothetical protein